MMKATVLIGVVLVLLATIVVLAMTPVEVESKSNYRPICYRRPTGTIVKLYQFRQMGTRWGYMWRGTYYFYLGRASFRTTCLWSFCVQYRRNWCRAWARY